MTEVVSSVVSLDSESRYSWQCFPSEQMYKLKPTGKLQCIQAKVGPAQLFR